MRTQLTGALIIAMALLASQVLAAPTLQQIGQTGATEIIIYTDSSKAVVRQQSVVRLAEGANSVGFDWTGDGVDAASVRLQGGQALAIGDVVRPAGADRRVQWTVRAPAAGHYPLTTSFLLSGLKWSADYWLGHAPARSEALLGGWLSIKNDSGMDLDDLTVTFVLGRPGVDGDAQATFPIRDLRELPRGSSVRSGFLRAMQVPVRTVHRIDSETAPERLRRVLEITPPGEGPLARTALPSGPLTIVMPTQMPPADMMKATLSYEPSEVFEVSLGEERDVIVERRLLDRRKTDVEFDRLGKVSGFDTVERYELEVRNRLREPLEIEVLETVLSTWELRTDALHVLEDGRALMRITVPADGESALEFTLVKHSGTRIP
ncbi:MAG: hypothetical protein ACOX9R_16230 [Armatimonadota bacterium]|jgi:hypothetical protein